LKPKERKNGTDFLALLSIFYEIQSGNALPKPSQLNLKKNIGKKPYVI